MTSVSTTIRVSVAQRERLRQLADQRSSTLTETLDAALESLRRDVFYREMADADERLRTNPDRFAEFLSERDAWFNADLGPDA